MFNYAYYELELFENSNSRKPAETKLALLQDLQANLREKIDLPLELECEVHSDRAPAIFGGVA